MVKREIITTESLDFVKKRFLEYIRTIESYNLIDKEEVYNSKNIQEILEKFPEVTKEKLISEGIKYFEFNDTQSAILSETSGTTGESLYTPRSLEELKWNSLNIKTAFSSFIDSRNSKVMLLNPGVMSPFMEACSRALEYSSIAYARCYPIENICTYDRIIQTINKYGITEIMTTPSLALKLLYEIDKKGLKINHKIKLLLTGEVLSNGMINNFNTLLESKGTYRFLYGSSECATVMIGSKNNQFEMLTDDFIFEFKPCSNSHNKNIFSLTLSWLRNGTRPLIRYNTNDLFIKEENKYFPIGRAMIDVNTVELNYLFDDELFNIPIKIYDYILNFKTKTMEIVVLNEDDKNYINSLINPIIKKFYKRTDIDIIVNSENNEFLKFAPRVKTKRFIYD